MTKDRSVLHRSGTDQAQAPITFALPPALIFGRVPADGDRHYEHRTGCPVAELGLAGGVLGVASADRRPGTLRR